MFFCFCSSKRKETRGGGDLGGRAVGVWYRVLGKDFKAKGKNSIYCYEVIFIFHFYDNLFVLKRIFPKS